MAMAYHPVFGATGTRKFSDNKFWYETSVSVNGIADCFSKASTDGSVSGRPDGKISNIIYNELWIDQRWRAEWIDGTKERTTIERDKDIAATQYADFVGSATWETDFYTTLNINGNGTPNFLYSSDSDAGTITLFNKLGLGVNSGATAHYGYLNPTRRAWVFVNSVPYEIAIFSSAQDQYVHYYLDTSRSTLTFTGTSESMCILAKQSNLRYGSNTFLHTDIIGNPANYPQVWKDALAGGGSITGSPLLVGENGENLIPDGVIDNFKLTKKTEGTRLLGYLRTTDSTNWGVIVYGDGWTFSDAGNFVTLTNEPSANVVLAQYKAYNNNLAPIANSKVVGGSAGVSDANIATFYGADRSNKLLQNCISKVGTNSNLSTQFLSSSRPITSGSIEGALVPISATWQENPAHSAWTISNDLSPTLKLFSYLTNTTNYYRHKQVYVFKEMKYDATGVNQDGTPTNTWGDNNQFSIVDNVSTMTDNNGNTLLIGQKARLVDYRVKE